MTTREAFETEARKHGFILDRLDKSGAYVQLITEQAWIIWQAATAAELAAPATAPDERIKELEDENEQLRKDAERYQWLKSAKGLTLESERGAPWTRENGSTFIPSHRLCAGGTQFAPHETLDDAIDAAMKGTP